MDPLQVIGLAFAGVMVAQLFSYVFAELAIGFYEGRRDWDVKPPRGIVRKWSYMQGYRMGVKYGRTD